MGKAIEELAHFAAGTPWEAIPGAVREHAKLVLLDTLGVILAGSVQPEVADVRARLTATGGRGATVYAPGWPTTDPRTAALLNGLAGRSIELCEGHRYVSCQGAVQVLPTALASAEWLERSGRETLAALIFGYEVAARLGAGLTARPLAHQNGQAPLLGAVAAGRPAARTDRRADEPRAPDRRDPRPHAGLHQRGGGRDRAERGRRDERLRRSPGARAGAGRRRRAAERHRGGLRPAGRRRVPARGRDGRAGSALGDRPQLFPATRLLQPDLRGAGRARGHPRRASTRSGQHRAHRRGDLPLRREHARARPAELLRGQVLAAARGRRAGPARQRGVSRLHRDRRSRSRDRGLPPAGHGPRGSRAQRAACRDSSRRG